MLLFLFKLASLTQRLTRYEIATVVVRITCALSSANTTHDAMKIAAAAEDLLNTSTLSCSGTVRAVAAEIDRKTHNHTDQSRKKAFEEAFVELEI